MSIFTSQFLRIRPMCNCSSGFQFRNKFREQVRLPRTGAGSRMTEQNPAPLGRIDRGKSTVGEMTEHNPAPLGRITRTGGEGTEALRGRGWASSALRGRGWAASTLRGRGDHDLSENKLHGR